MSALSSDFVVSVVVQGRNDSDPSASIQLGEGAVWDADAQLLYWIDITAKRLFIYDPSSDTNRSLPLPYKPGTVVQTRTPHLLLLPLSNGFSFLDTRTGAVTHTGIDPEAHLPHNRFNDGKCDPKGRLCAGTMHVDAATPHTGALYSLSADMQCRTLMTGVTISNGIVWTRDGSTLYYIDSNAFNVRAFPYDVESGSIGEGRVVMEIPDGWGKADGCTIDEHDNLWIAAWNGNKGQAAAHPSPLFLPPSAAPSLTSSCFPLVCVVVCYDPRQQKELLTIPIPSRYVTSCAFGGPDLADLYVTSASAGEGWPADYDLEPLAGSLFVVKGLRVKGVKSVPFAGSLTQAGQ